MNSKPITTHGGARSGAGRKPKEHVATGAELEFNRARARNEAAKASLNEHRAMVARNDYLSRATVRQASAKAVAALAQSLLGLPDTLERTCGLTPYQADLAQKAVDAALTDASEAFRRLADGELTGMSEQRRAVR